MIDTTKLNTLFEAFDSWQRPWIFFAAHKTAADLNNAELHALEAIWALACASEHWQRPNASDCTLLAEHALTMVYPWLSTTAKHQIVNAAAFQWK